MDEIKSKKDEKRRRRRKPTPICRETGDHVHYPPTRRTIPTRPRNAPSPILESIFRVTPKLRYGECRKNQAADIGTTAYDGCGEFVSATAGEDPSNCAACGCHRSFHREESLSDDGVPKTILEVLKISSHRFRQIFCSPYGDRKTKRIAMDRSCGGDLPEEEEEGRVKRVKTKFTAEQTKKMRSYAEKLRWKLSSESKEEVERFCIEIGVSRENFRVWMNNHNEVHGGDSPEEEEEGREKRLKTKFTAEQTEKMRSYAEELRWKVSPESREEVEAFCIEIGVNRKKFRVWMNNHKVKN